MDARQDQVGTKVGNFVLLRELGRGGMGEVYLAEHPELGRQVAIKLLSAEISCHPQAGERFLIEARAASRIKHPQIVEVYDFGRTDAGIAYCMMELLEGHELGRTISERSPMSPSEVLPYLQQICSALQAAHDHGVVHRDLKPENIIVVAGDPLRLKIVDFGLAKLLEPHPDHAPLTQTGMVMGTPLTIAPEQAAGRVDEIGPRTDLYSLGVILYWMLSGSPPFSGGTVPALLEQHRSEAPPPLHGVPPEVARLVHACLAKRPLDRPACADQLAEQFARAIAAAPGPNPEPPAVRPPKAPAAAPDSRRELALAATLAPPARAARIDPAPNWARRATLGVGLALLAGAAIAVWSWSAGNQSSPGRADAATRPAAPRPDAARAPDAAVPALDRESPTTANLKLRPSERRGRVPRTKPSATKPKTPSLPGRLGEGTPEF